MKFAIAYTCFINIYTYSRRKILNYINLQIFKYIFQEPVFAICTTANFQIGFINKEIHTKFLVALARWRNQDSSVAAATRVWAG
jgi:hypothetical protein